ncbi:MAG: hypothetical protein NVSMB65_17330 [Chloroflexota bacterium]
MIYLIGGPPRCGKTTVARDLAARLGCSWLQSDHLGAAIARYVPETDAGLLRPAVECLALDNDLRYATFSPLEVVDHYRGRAEAAWPGLRAFIEATAGDGAPMIVEGYHLEPAFLRRLIPEARRAVRALFLYRTGLEETAASILRGTDPHDWVLRRTERAETVPRIATMIVRYGEAIREAAAREGCAALAMDGPFHQRVAEAVRLLAETPAEGPRSNGGTGAITGRGG